MTIVINIPDNMWTEFHYSGFLTNSCFKKRITNKNQLHGILMYVLFSETYTRQTIRETMNNMEIPYTIQVYDKKFMFIANKRKRI